MYLENEQQCQVKNRVREGKKRKARYEQRRMHVANHRIWEGNVKSLALFSEVYAAWLCQGQEWAWLWKWGQVWDKSKRSRRIWFWEEVVSASEGPVVPLAERLTLGSLSRLGLCKLKLMELRKYVPAEHCLRAAGWLGWEATWAEPPFLSKSKATQLDVIPWTCSDGQTSLRLPCDLARAVELQ